MFEFIYNETIHQPLLANTKIFFLFMIFKGNKFFNYYSWPNLEENKTKQNKTFFRSFVCWFIQKLDSYENRLYVCFENWIIVITKLLHKSFGYKKFQLNQHTHNRWSEIIVIIISITNERMFWRKQNFFLLNSLFIITITNTRHWRMYHCNQMCVCVIIILLKRKIHFFTPSIPFSFLFKTKKHSLNQMIFSQ